MVSVVTSSASSERGEGQSHEIATSRRRTSRVPKAREIRDRLEQEILTGICLPGERLDEQVLAQRFHVSRTPVREALNQLASTGIVELVPNRGAFVRAMSIRELVQMFEVMAELEGMAGRLATRRADPDALGRIRATLERCEMAAEGDDPDAYYAENERFHKAIYDACGNDFLAAEARRLHDRLRAFRRLQLHVPRRVGHSLDEHRRVVAAIAAGHEAEAEAELRRHILIQGERFADFVATLPG